jgi:hypothetical protein
MRKTKIVLALSAALSLASMGAANAGPPNKAGQDACKNGGWQHSHRPDGSRFTNQGDCVSWAAHGGAVVADGGGET